MKERPILFSGSMVPAILDGRKTVTRRVVKPQPDHNIDKLHGNDLRNRAPYMTECFETGVKVGLGFQDDDGILYHCPYGGRGTRLWVRETWRLSTTDDCACYEPCRCQSGLPMYRAMSDDPEEDGPWKPSIFMPRWASRITLEVTGVRAERVQDITEADAVAEGVDVDWIDGLVGRVCKRYSGEYLPPAKVAFERLWDSINAKRGYGWAVNPWVWVVEFKRIEVTQ